MRPSWYKPDAGLAARMVFTMFLLGAIYVVFAQILRYAFGAPWILLVVGALAIGGIQLFLAGKVTFCNPFQSIVVRAVEVLYARDEALRIFEDYSPPDVPFVASVSRAATGMACTEAPRGLLYHRYQLDPSGQILGAKIVPPTSQNQKAIEQDLKRVVTDSLSLPDEELTSRCEQTVRNYDPCISCATHFFACTWPVSDPL